MLSRDTIRLLARAMDRASVTTEMNAVSAIMNEIHRGTTLDEIAYTLFQKYSVSVWRCQQWELERHCVPDDESFFK